MAGGDAAVGESEDEDADVYLAEAVAASALPAGARRPKKDDTWIVDSGASYIFTPYEADFDGPLSEPITDQVRVGNGTVLPILGQGTVKVQGPEGGCSTLTGVHLVPAMHSRLLSVGHFTDKGAKAVFEGTTCEVYKGKKLLFTGRRTGKRGSGLPRASLPVVHQPAAEACEAAAVSMDLAHKRLAHAAPSTIAKMVRKGTAVGLKVDDLKGKVHCEPCLMGKAQRLPFPQASKTTVKKLLGLVAMDMWGPARVPTLGRKSIYVLSFIDYLSGRVWAYLLPNKEAATVLAAAQKWLVKAQRQCGEKLHTLRSDNGTEFKGVMGSGLRPRGLRGSSQLPTLPSRTAEWNAGTGP